MTKYIHDYTISFTVHTTEPDPYKVDGQMVRDAIIQRHASVNNVEIIEIIDHLQTMSERE
jgi:hypothetical protein|tara:strand:+ start:763 stop:942 length:180 start_codon:yes stop_codon:yes gene_type:complete